MTISLTSIAKHIFLDVVGFTRDRSVEAQADIVAKLNSIVSSAVTTLQIPPEKTIFLPTGDGICVTLLDLMEPFDIHILLAKEILQGVYNHNTGEKDLQRQFVIRIGINENVDNIVQDVNGRKNVAGLGINMAQRIMNCGDGGQILVGQTVYEVLRSREKYMKSFRQFSAVGKHDIRFNVFQYLEQEAPGLNTEIPLSFTPSAQKTEPKLSKYLAYYFAYAQLNYDFLFSQKDEPSNEYVSVILLHFLARDAVNRSEVGKYGSSSPDTWKSGEASFEEQYRYYDEIDFSIKVELAMLIERVFLSDISFCFEKAEYSLTSYIFLNDIGRRKLINEFASIIAEFQIDIH